MPKRKTDTIERGARIQIRMAANIDQVLEGLAQETGVSRVLLGSMALSIGVMSLKNALEAAKTGDPMAAAPRFLADVSSVLAGYQLGEVDK